MKQPSFFDVDERLARSSGLGDQLEAFSRTVDFEVFRPDLDKALAYSDGSKGGRPPFNPVLMFKILVIQTLNNLSDERTEYLINDRLSFMRFLGLGLSNRVPDAKTVWLFRERLSQAGALRDCLSGLTRPCATPVICLCRARSWTLKFTKAKRQDGGTIPSMDLAIPFFGYKSHISIDRKFRLIRKWKTTHAAANDGTRLREGMLDKTSTASGVWADTACRSKANEDFMEKQGFVPKVHRKKPHLKPMPRHIQISNAGKSVIRSRVEHVFADQKSQTGLFIRTVGITRAVMRIRLANIVYNMRRFLLLVRINASA